MIYILMMLAVGPTGWQIVPIEGNPYQSFADCTVVRNVLLFGKVFKWGLVQVTNFRCVPRRVKELK